MKQPYDASFNCAIMSMANRVCPAGYDVVEDGGATSLADVQRMIKDRHRLTVDSRYSEDTIFGCPEHNHAFRAWHDWTHWILRAEFTLDGELAVAHRQCEDLARIYGHGLQVRAWCRLIMGEVYGQAHYREVHGHFAASQPAVTLAYAAMSVRQPLRVS
jgi:hypothetical protein